MILGFLVNPVAGMGGAVGLKGTDGVVAEALRRGAHPASGARAKMTMNRLRDAGFQILTCSGKMGETVLHDAGFESFRVVHTCQSNSTARDTQDAVRTFIENGAELIVFCGGDGTARDVLEVVGRDIPILGIPAGVKMYSAVFAVDPAAAASVLGKIAEATFYDAEVVDVDEDAYRDGELKTRLFGYARVPCIANQVQVTKGIFEDQDEDRAKEEIASFISEIMRNDTLYILGAGTTTEYVAQKIGTQKTLLGVDVIKQGKILAEDATEKILLDLISCEARVKILVSPIGAQGFIFGRGSQQISPQVIRNVGIANVIVIATPGKLARTRTLYVDTGDPSLDAAFGDSIQVISGYRIAQRKVICHPGTCAT
jgi:predicted polyphosphate/ATP-dependent NAD kinase